eukprot:CAMPEP_0119179094 /NCGR_PEP_ID=MMETSP1315-20130426/53389_1 /TAXON_ID=676789 /ORGANISM="Prasinoderma singularis, Strain RCC927" /LENGTH=46 /DNA_ID= /DNA_START= /DNA_END= /DNA_ORIENTATION=
MKEEEVEQRGESHQRLGAQHAPRVQRSGVGRFERLPHARRHLAAAE